jgi:hypothetical protein
MFSLILKIISIPVLLWAASLMSPGIHYPSFYQPLATGIIISGVGRLAEKLFLKPGTVLLSVFADAILATLIIYYSQYVFAGARITWAGAAVTSLIIGVVEYIIHVMLVNQVQQGTR